jgi:starvation-inducible DNA-binding protein
MEVTPMSKKAQATVKTQGRKASAARRQDQGSQVPSKQASDNSSKQTGKQGQTLRFRTRNDLSQETRAGSVELLNARLADCFDLYSQTKQAHWNVKGRNFISLHELFDDIATSLSAFADEIAERAVALGGYATGTVRMASSTSQLPEYPTNIVDSFDHLEAMIERLAIFGRAVRESIERCDELDDDDTQDMLTDISRVLDKHLWFLEAHTQAEENRRDGGEAKFAARRSKR